jgi:uncharacterized protein
MSHQGAPGPRRARIESLDVLRGVGVLGIFMVNVQAFAMTPFGYANPTLEADFGPQGAAVWVWVVTLFQMKFITIFSALFGAGIVLMAGEGDDVDRSALHVRRVMWLLAIGALHAYALWYGDILVPYAVAGLLLAGVRGWSVGRLALVGVLLVIASAALIAAATSAAAFLPEADLAEFVAEAWAPPPEVVAAEQQLFRSPWPARFGHLAGIATEHELEQLVYYLPRFLGVMMLGMALLKSGFLTGGWRIASYLQLAALAPLGAVLSWRAAQMQIAADFDLIGVMPGQALLSAASLPQALGYAALVMLACRVAALAPLRAPFAAVGRMALTCYLGCSALGWFVFHGPPGLGRIGTLTRLDQVELVLWTWLGMLVLAPLWLRAFAFGPIEWVWRTLTYGRRQPFLAAPGGAPAP